MPRKNSTKIVNKTKITVQLDFPTEEILNSQTVNELGQAIQEESIRFMEAGVSPVDGRKFERYKNTEKYPKNVRKSFPDKKNTPVNLKLSGNLYDSFGWKKHSDKSFIFGLLNPKGDADVYGAVHNRDDTGRSDIPERRFLPTRVGELFNKSIMLEIRRIIVDRIARLIK